MSNISSLELSQLRLLAIIFETKNLTRAGERAGLTQSAVSHALKKLRDNFNDSLVIRQGNKLVLTPRAEALSIQLSRWLNDFDRNILNQESFEPSTSKRTFYIATSDLVEQVIAPKLTQLLSHTAPHIQLIFIKLNKQSFAYQIDSNEADFVISVVNSSHPSLMVTTLYEDNFMSAVRHDHPILSTSLNAEIFCQYPHILAGTGKDNRGVVDDELEKLGLAREVQYKVANFSSAPYIIETSDSILTAPKKFIENVAGKFAITPFKTPVDLASYNMKLYWHIKNKDDLGNQWLRQQIKLCL